MAYKKKTKKPKAHFVMLLRKVLMSEEWQELTRAEMITYIYFKNNYIGSNNGEISLTYKEMHRILQTQALSEAIRGLIKKNWITKTKQGGLYGGACKYKLTGKYDPQVKG